MQKIIQKEAENNYLKRILVVILAVIMMAAMLRPQMVQAAAAGKIGRASCRERV